MPAFARSSPPANATLVSFVIEPSRSAAEYPASVPIFLDASRATSPAWSTISLALAARRSTMGSDSGTVMAALLGGRLRDGHRPEVARRCVEERRGPVADYRAKAG